MTLILGALDEEIDGIRAAMDNLSEDKAGAFPVYIGTLNGKKLILCRCGVGKANAAAAVSAALTAYPEITRVINTGVAGGIDKSLKRGDVVLGEKTVYHDFDQSPDGLKKGQVQGFDSEFFDADKALLSAVERALIAEGINYRKGIIATGDRFIADKAKAESIHNEFGAIACEMESASAAQVCAIYGVPFLAVRAISDNGCDEAVTSFYEFLHMAAGNNARAILKLMGNK